MSNDLFYGEALKVHEYLMTERMEEITHSNMVSILANAMKRISDLEARLARAEKTVSYAANVASCLANGITPD